MKIDNLLLIEDLQDRTQKASALATVFCKLEESKLQYKPDANSWSVLECITHLNRYYAFYIPLLTKAIASYPAQTGSVFKPGILGQFFVRLMEPKANKIKKMKAMAKMNPNGSQPDKKVLNQFVEYQKELLSVLERCKQGNLNKPQIPTVMSKWITISLGDTLRFIVVHNERHLLQAQNCLKTGREILV